MFFSPALHCSLVLFSTLSAFPLRSVALFTLQKNGVTPSTYLASCGCRALELTPQWDSSLVPGLLVCRIHTVLGELRVLNHSFLFLPSISDVGKAGKIYWEKPNRSPVLPSWLSVSMAFHFPRCYIWITYVLLLQLVS